MGILARISEAKTKFRAAQKNKRELGIKQLEAENKKLEQEYKSEKTYYDLKQKKSELKRKNIEMKTAPIRKFAKGIQKTINESKERGSKNNPFYATGSKGDIFGGSGSNIFNSQKKQKPKSKGKKIIIQI